jgi:hypothetical protein
VPVEEPAAVIPADPEEQSILRIMSGTDYQLGSSGLP